MAFNIEIIATSLGKASKSGQGWLCCCPAHNDHEPSLSIGVGHQNQLLLYCHGGCSFEAILKTLQERGLLPERSTDRHTYQNPVNAKSLTDNTVSALSYIRQLWHQSLPLDGTLAHLYVRTRLDNRLQDIPPTLRYLPSANHTPTGKAYPCLLAAVTRYPDRKLTALHRTFLSADGLRKAPVETPKMMMGTVRGGAVRLAPAGEELVISEGIETGLTVQVMFKKPTWAALSSRNMGHVVLPPLPLAKTLYIAQDNDEAGRQGALALAEKAWAEGRAVHILQPPHRFNDFNDLLFYGESHDLT